MFGTDKKEPKNVRLDIEACPWDTCDFYGRWNHYRWIFDPRLSLVDGTTVSQAREVLRLYKSKAEPPGTTNKMVIHAKRLYENSVHPDSGCEVPRMLRFSSILPSQLLLTTAMVTFCRTMPVVWFWQLAHNGYHASVNWANGNATAPRSQTSRAAALGSAAIGASLVAIPFKSKISQLMCKSRLRSLVPFIVVLSSHAANVPLSRQHELWHGVDLHDKSGYRIGPSRVAALHGIGQVVVSRMFMFAPAMFVVPIITPILERRIMAQRRPWAVPALQVLISSVLIMLMVPVSCALFSQSASIRTSTLEKTETSLHRKIIEQAKLRKEPVPEQLYFNKGL